LLKAAPAYYSFLITRSQFTELHDVAHRTLVQLGLMEALNVESDEERLLQGILLSRYADALYHRSRIEESRIIAARSLDILRSFDKPDEGEIVRLLNSLALANHNLGDWQMAEKYYLECIAVTSRASLNDTYATAARLNLALMFRLQGRLLEAQAQLSDGLSESVRMEDVRGQGYAYRNLGMILTDMGRYEEARRTLDEAFTRFAQLDDAYGKALTKLYTSVLELNLANLAQAQQDADESLTMLTKLGNEYALSYALIQIAELDRFEGRYARAIQGCTRAMEILQRAKVPTQIAVCQHLQGKIAMRERRWQEANTLLRESLRTYDEHQCRQQLCSAAADLALISFEMHDVEEAIRQLHHALALATSIQAAPLLGEALISAATLLTHSDLDAAKRIVDAVRQHANVSYETKLKAARLTANGAGRTTPYNNRRWTFDEASRGLIRQALDVLALLDDE
jgi:tetratricopeptide (TPR) repeat protein